MMLETWIVDLLKETVQEIASAFDAVDWIEIY